MMESGMLSQVVFNSKKNKNDREMEIGPRYDLLTIERLPYNLLWQFTVSWTKMEIAWATEGNILEILIVPN